MEQLIRLQNIDTKLKDLNDLLGDLPSKVEDLNNQEESTKNSIIRKKSRSKEIDLEINKTELEVSDLSGKIDKLKDQLFLANYLIICHLKWLECEYRFQVFMLTQIKKESFVN